ncbi:solute carrier family 12 member 8 isoform X1 [Hydra vulgaris]|uniref:solute carrier family 12 member 8 isoform X1 n=1 Tax=Hydra vulgaris TaxID=6087 RepID=UPI001F5FC738|nr:solute carrier family 12 member 8 [Hydra vulgaris]
MENNLSTNKNDCNEFNLQPKSEHSFNEQPFPKAKPDKKFKELFEDEKEQNGEKLDSWWKSSFFVTSKLYFGTWDGVFTSCIMNMVSVVVFLRSGWMIGYAGIGLSLLIVLLSFLIAFVTLLSAVGIFEKCCVTKGGVYFLITHVLGGKIGGTIGLLYSIGNATATSLYCTGFAESLCQLANWNNKWSICLVSITTLFVMLSIAISGVKWVVRFQLLLLVIIAAGIMDFVIGTLALSKPEIGFTGFSNYNFKENLNAQFTDQITFFVVFGVFFPSACGVMAGINMSGDLKNPAENIPEGSVASLGTCAALYTTIVLFLGSTCSHYALQTDYMIMQKMSITGVLLLCGLFVAALSSVLGGLVGPPRVLQSIATDNVLSILKPLEKVKGINEEPHNATLTVAVIAFVFIFVGNMNTLAPIVTMPFLMTYSAVNYAYFALSMSFENLKKQGLNTANYGAMSQIDPFSQKNSNSLISPTDTNEASLQPSSNSMASQSKSSSEYSLILSETVRKESFAANNENGFRNHTQSNSICTILCNKWISLIASICCILCSFCISWIFALTNLAITFLLYVFISWSQPGLPQGVSNHFSLSYWLLSVCMRKNRKSEKRIVVHSDSISYGISMLQVSEDNSDYYHRLKQHHSSTCSNPIPY